MNKIGFGLLWLGFIGYAFFLAPPDNPATLGLIINLSTGNWTGINPLIIALFNLMGIWPLIYACLLLIDGRGQKIPAWPFVILSFGVGAFGLLPYLALRQPNPQFTGEKDWLLKVVDSRIIGIMLSLGAISLLVFGFWQGNWGEFVREWQSSRFIHVMSWDFCLLCGLFPALLGDDLSRRGVKNDGIFWVITFLPLIGPLAYLCFRPPLANANINLKKLSPL